MGGSKPKPVQTPFQNQQAQTNTYGRVSIADSPEAKEFMSLPLNFGGSYGDLNTNVEIDPGVGRRTDLAEQEAENRYNSVFNSNVPRFFREANQAKELREIRSQGAAEAQQAKYAQQQAQRGLEFQKAQLVEGANRDRVMAELERRRLLLPNIVQTGGSGSSSGYNTQIMPGQQGWFGSLLQGAGSAIGGLAAGGLI
jgi:hypothetical protein